MPERLGIGHLFDLSSTEAMAGFLTPLAIFSVIFSGAAHFARKAGDGLCHQSGDW